MAKRLANTLVTLGLLAGGGYLMYRFGLTDEAKANLSRAIKSARSSYDKISAIVAETSGVQDDLDGYLPNVEATDRQWESLGY